MAMLKWFVQSVLATACAAATATAALGGTVTLKASVRMPASAGEITLADIAELDGEAAQRFAGLPIMEWTGAGVVEIPLRDVRARLDEAGVHWGRVSVSGRSVVVRPARDSAAAPPLAMTSISIDETPVARTPPPARRDEVLAAEVIDQPTVRGMIASMVATNLKVAASDLRLNFAAADGEWLDLPLETARFQVQPLSSFASDRIEMTVRRWSGGRAESGRNISVLPLLRVCAATLARDVQKDQVITEHDVSEVEQWLPPSQAAQNVGRIAAVGRVASKPMRSGETLRDKHVRRATLIKRGDLVIVRCLVGGVVISLQAEARAEGTEGETIEFRKQGERETFLATITGRGEAVLDMNRR